MTLKISTWVTQEVRITRFGGQGREEDMAASILDESDLRRFSDHQGAMASIHLHVQV